MSYEPDRGDIVWIMLKPSGGHEQSGHRPAIVLSPHKYNSKTGLMICCPITSQEKKYPFEVKIPKEQPVSGVILADQVKSLDWHARQVKFICRIPQSITIKVVDKLSLLLLK